MYVGPALAGKQLQSIFFDRLSCSRIKPVYMTYSYTLNHRQTFYCVV